MSGWSCYPESEGASFVYSGRTKTLMRFLEFFSATRRRDAITLLRGRRRRRRRTGAGGTRQSRRRAAEARAPPGGSDVGATGPRRVPAPHRQEDFARRSTTRVRLSNRPAARKIAPSEFQRVLSPRPAPPSRSERRLALARSVQGTQWCD